jgi:hypothetical protein
MRHDDQTYCGALRASILAVGLLAFAAPSFAQGQAPSKEDSKAQTEVNTRPGPSSNIGGSNTMGQAPSAEDSKAEDEAGAEPGRRGTNRPQGQRPPRSAPSPSGEDRN